MVTKDWQTTRDGSATVDLTVAPSTGNKIIFSCKIFLNFFYSDKRRWDVEGESWQRGTIALQKQAKDNILHLRHAQVY